MRNLEEYGHQCIEELDTLGIDVTLLPDITWKVSRGKRILGFCRLNIDTQKASISVSRIMLDEDIVKNDVFLKEVIIHELLHALCPGEHHGGKWKYMAECVNRKSDNKYQITRVASHKRFGIPDETYFQDMKYLIKCQKCGKSSYRKRTSKVIKYPENFRCVCGGSLHVEHLK